MGRLLSPVLLSGERTSTLNKALSQLGFWIRTLRYACVEGAFSLNILSQPFLTTEHPRLPRTVFYLRPQDLDGRLAAVESIKQFFGTLSTFLHENVILDKRVFYATLFTRVETYEVFVLLYDIMNDDDEDVRQGGAEIVSTILPCLHHIQQDRPAFVYSPPAARQRLISCFTKIDGPFMALQKIAVAKASGDVGRCTNFHFDFSVPELQITPSVQMSDTRCDDLFRQLASGEIFEEECQNLYIDLVREAHIWSDIITGLEMLPKPHRGNGDLSLLQNRMQSVVQDGCFGIFTDARNYLLAFLCIRTTLLEAGLHALCPYACYGWRLMVNPIDQLKTVYTVCRERDLHTLLLLEMEEVEVKCRGIIDSPE